MRSKKNNLTFIFLIFIVAILIILNIYYYSQSIENFAAKPAAPKTNTPKTNTPRPIYVTPIGGSICPPNNQYMPYYEKCKVEDASCPFSTSHFKQKNETNDRCYYTTTLDKNHNNVKDFLARYKNSSIYNNNNIVIDKFCPPNTKNIDGQCFINNKCPTNYIPDRDNNRCILLR